MPAPSEDFAVLFGQDGRWVELEPDTDGHHLTTHSTTGPPTWDDPQGGGGVVPNAANEGEILYDDGGDWVSLAVGTAGQLLQTNGVAAPTWVTPAVLAGALGDVLYNDGSNWVSLPKAADTPAPLGLNGLNLLRSSGGIPLWQNIIPLPTNVTGGEIVVYDGLDASPQWKKLEKAAAAGRVLQSPGTLGVPVWVSQETIMLEALNGKGSGYVRFTEGAPDTLITNNRIPETDLFINATTTVKELVFASAIGAQPVLTHAPIGQVIAQADGTGTPAQILETFDDSGTPNVRWIDPPTGTVAAAGTLGRILYDDGAAWVALAIGTSGQRLTSGGAGAPTWETENALPSGIIGDVLIHNGSSYISLNADTNFKVLTTKGAGNVAIWDFLRAH